MRDLKNRPAANQISIFTPHYTFLSSIVLLIPALLVAGAAFAPTRRGPIIAGLFLLPPVIFAAIRSLEKFRGNYSWTVAIAPLPFCAILGVLAAFLLPYAFLGIDTPYLWWIWACLASALTAGIIIGLSRHDSEGMRNVLERRFTRSGGRLVANHRVQGSLCMRESTGSASLDLFVKVAWVIYAVIVTVGMLLGGGTAFVFTSILDDIFPRPAELDIRVIIIEVVALLAIGPLGIWLPAFWRMWRGIAALEHRSGA